MERHTWSGLIVITIAGAPGAESAAKENAEQPFLGVSAHEPENAFPGLLHLGALVTA